MKSIQLQAERPTRTEKISGVEFLVGVSPYFFPDRLECNYDRAAGVFVITFRYLDNEPVDETSDINDGLVDIRVGQHTRRIRSITVHAEKNSIDRVGVLVFDKIPEALGRMPAPRRSDVAENYRFARDAILNHRTELANCLAR